MDHERIGQTTIADAARLGVAASALRQVDGVSVAIVPIGEHEYEVQPVDVEKYLPTPRRKTGKFSTRDVGSFIDYINLHKTAGTVVWADSAGGMRAVINGHEPGGAPGWRDHVVTLRREPTLGYSAWVKRNGQPMSQETFAEFLEDRLTEIASPDGAELIEVAKFFQFSKKIGFTSSRLLHNGQVQFSYAEDIAESGGQSGNTTVPTEFTLVLRPYRDGDEAITVPARLRWSIGNDHKLSFRFVLAEVINERLDEIHADAIDRVRVDTGVPVLLQGGE